MKSVGDSRAVAAKAPQAGAEYRLFSRKVTACAQDALFSIGIGASLAGSYMCFSARQNWVSGCLIAGLLGALYSYVRSQRAPEDRGK